MGVLGRLFLSKGWNGFPRTFVAGLERRLGEDNFRALKALVEKYDCFGPRLFADPQGLDIDNEMTGIEVVSLLTSAGAALMRGHRINDAMIVFSIALCLRPDYSPALGTLAMIYHHTGRTDEARQHAARAVAEMDRDKERFKDIPSLQLEGLDEYRNQLARIADGEKVL